MKRFLAMTALGLFALTANVQATPIENVTEPVVQLEEGYVLTKDVLSLTYILDNISATYLESEEVEATEENFMAYLEANYENGVIATINEDKAIVRQDPDQESEIVVHLQEGIPVFVSERIDNYYKIEILGISGYVYKTQIDETLLGDLPYTKSEVTLPLAENPNYLGNQIVAYGKQFLGNPYVYGGNSLTKGVDCSGFTSQVFKHFGISLQRSSRSQFASNGYKVSRADMLPGDLIFYGYNGNIDHVAIYAGNGQIIHASTPKTGICMGNVDYGKPIIGIKRVVQ